MTVSEFEYAAATERGRQMQSRRALFALLRVTD